jgi:hypothetical protein
MHEMKNVFLAVALSVVFCASVNAQEYYGTSDFASYLNNTGRFHHAKNYGGAEVIYRSSGFANESDAMRWWMNSPPHRRLVQSGMIQEIRCVGNVCVGRGGNGGGGNIQNMNSADTTTYTSMSDANSCQNCNSGYNTRQLRIRIFRR